MKTKDLKKKSVVNLPRISMHKAIHTADMTCYATVKRASQSAGVKGLVCMICANWAFLTWDYK